MYIQRRVFVRFSPLILGTFVCFFAEFFDPIFLDRAFSERTGNCCCVIFLSNDILFSFDSLGVQLDVGQARVGQRYPCSLIDGTRLVAFNGTHVNLDRRRLSYNILIDREA